jgi:hypothetical protein
VFYCAVAIEKFSQVPKELNVSIITIAEKEKQVTRRR